MFFNPLIDAAVIVGFGIALTITLFIAEKLHKKYFPKPAPLRGATRI